MVDFVAAVVKATGHVEMVPADWLDHPVLGTAYEAAPDPAEVTVEPAEVVSEVQVDLSTQEDLPISPTAREAVLAAREAEASGAVPTEDDTHKVIDAFADRAGIELGEARTKAEKVAVISAHLNTGDTESSDETPATGDEEN